MDLTTRLTATLTLPSPVLAAAGAFGYGTEVGDLTEGAGMGALITPTLTLAPRPGNPMPRTAEATAGLIHALGLPNPGLETFLRERLPLLRTAPFPVIVSIRGETAAEWTRLAGSLAATGVPVALELNLSPASLWDATRSHEQPLTEAETLAQTEAAVAAVRSTTSLPLIAKLPAVGAEVGAAAQAAERAGADVICVAQAFPAVAMRLSGRKFRLPGVVGGLSGPAIKPLALYQVWRVAQVVRLPILGCGGVMTADDAVEFLLAGASAVAVGIASSIHPATISRIAHDLSVYLTAHHFSSPAELVGLAARS